MIRHHHSRKRPLIEGRTAVYHVISRTTRDEFLFGDREKEVFRSLLWKQAAFHGVEILTYCVMSNHFHLLIRIPHQDTLSDDDLLERYRVRYSGPNRPFSAPPPEVVDASFAREDADSLEFRKRLHSRMASLPVFMRELKTAFCIWYNRAHQNHGTIWAERYKSLIVENDPAALKIVAAYIDLNPVRAKITDDPGNYRWCGYAEAISGFGPAKNGLCGLAMGDNGRWKLAIAAYRTILFGKGRVSKGDRTKNHGRIPPEVADAVIENRGEMSASEAIRHRVRYFTDGLAIGSKEYLESYFMQNRERFGAKRKSGPREMDGAEWGNLHTMRQLRNPMS